MKCESNGYFRLTIYMICISHMIFTSIQLCKGATKEEGNERILSRRRRYLIFPEGSSLQIVYDTYHPVVDYTNLLVVGITGALALELPSKPVYLEEQLKEIYRNGSLPLLRRNDDNFDDGQLQDEPLNDIYKHLHEPNIQPTYATKLADLYWSYGNNKMKKSSEKSTVNTNYNQWNKQNFQSSRNLLHLSPHHHQYMHPMYGKRSISDDVTLTAEEKFNLENHRKSRHHMYRQLEKFIDTTGHNGRDCVLKALCEMGQNKQDEKLRSFLGEIMKTVFSLPDLQLIQWNAPEEIYDVAHSARTNCTDEYPKCSQSLWKTIFH